jgi:hypothetical protein
MPRADDGDDDGRGWGWGCSQADLAANDRRAQNTTRVVTLALAPRAAHYDRKCMLVSPGQSVTASANQALRGTIAVRP